MLTLPPNSSGWHILRYIMVMRNLLAISLVCVAGRLYRFGSNFLGGWVCFTRSLYNHRYRGDDPGDSANWSVSSCAVIHRDNNDS
jgi:hypothetical protein